MQLFSKNPLPVLSVLISMFIGLLFTGCNDDIFSTNPNDKLSFSKDTLTFDTVFTTVGSATSKIMIYNKSNFALKISDLSLGGGKISPFKINVDGSLSANNQFKDIEIRAKDSMYVFVSVTVNPQSEDSPVFIQDSIVFQTNGVVQKVKLQAYGQNMIVLKNHIFRNDTTLTDIKPYLVVGYIAVDSAKTLTIEKGCRFYFHNNANVIVYGNLIAKGTAEKPISMRGDRLDKIKFETPFPYNYVAGQWGGVFLLWNKGNHLLQHVNMTSGYVGIYFYNNSNNTIPQLIINDCKIHNFLLYGLVVKNGNLTLTNSEISNSSSYNLYLNGGKHTILQSTIANYFDRNDVSPVSRDKTPAVMIMNLEHVSPMETVFKNCVIAGSYENEFTLATRYPDDYQGIFDHCYIRKTDSLKLKQFTNIRWYNRKDTLIFKSGRYNVEKNIYFNFMPDSISPLRGKADPSVASQFPLDLNGNIRPTDKPDMGAYQWQPVKK